MNQIPDRSRIPSKRLAQALANMIIAAVKVLQKENEKQYNSTDSK